ncbi:hypothetical protein lacNasYZ03_12550 [Lactobacillus nasalidis]|uniref:B3/B4 tRNA-binding domain-containing protein n=1 Tax=Lactobacillus nasalidis TaxID=2797258 RepID=A0ABQ3W4V3_9LACO|nr:phenylalanine--tRNA ligase beta subunit-related protein [Lactobacillus nasalidis]GHV97106.1 hypothetical protein lacNasYZ01_02880 [Lactobacillus nasalidis]GHV99583.1 hypothetical protein lacNasYZ02_10130 [Lactobacillus nasalidis]GHW01568.1 hypothetical protein lacNasYZ03_12550 [Lactobacillus nasalidis]
MLEKVTVDNSFWDLFPEAQVNIMLVSGIDNHDSDDNLARRRKLLREGSDKAEDFLGASPFSKNQVVDEWRKAYQQFKKKKGARASIEALLKRIDKGEELRPISPLVDVYNSVSLAHGVPIGIEDQEKLAGTMHLGLVHEGLAFRPVGADKEEPTLEGEVAWYDDEGAVCRCLNWRDAQRTMLDEDSTKGVIVIESVTAEQAQRASEAMNDLAGLLEEFFGIKPDKSAVLTKDEPSVDVD